MVKSIKLKNNTYWDSSSIVKTKKPLNKFLVEEIKEITKSINISQANLWVNTGIDGKFLASGTYVFEVYINAGTTTRQYDERLSGILAWYNDITNSANADEIPLSKSGHARNNHDIKLRVLRQPGSDKHTLLQISDSIIWNGTGLVTFRFRKII